MRGSTGGRRLAAVTVTALALLGPAAMASSASPRSGRVSVSGAVTRTFSFIAKANSKTTTVVNIDSLLINARCNSRGEPVVFAFSSAARADLFGRVFDGLGRIHIIKNSSFTKQGKGVQLSTTTGDFDSTGTVLFETSSGAVVTVNYAFDNSTTLSKQAVCTVFGSLMAS
jgi:hypothetical protein